MQLSELPKASSFKLNKVEFCLHSLSKGFGEKVANSCRQGMMQAESSVALKGCIKRSVLLR